MSSLVVERSRPSAAGRKVLAALRMAVFREWPYLYAGDAAYEEAYIAEFLGSAQAALVVARDGAEPVGVATASPLASQPDSLCAPLVAAGIDVARSFYFGESVLLPAYQGQGIGHRFFDEREAAARAFGAATAVFCAVVRDPAHPARPGDARELAPFWRKRGYAPLAGVTCSMDWRELGEAAERAHVMQFWARDLAPA